MSAVTCCSCKCYVSATVPGIVRLVTP
jgi:hypothetical protein